MPEWRRIRLIITYGLALPICRGLGGFPARCSRVWLLRIQSGGLDWILRNRRIGYEVAKRAGNQTIRRVQTNHSHKAVAKSHNESGRQFQRNPPSA